MAYLTRSRRSPTWRAAQLAGAAVALAAAACSGSGANPVPSTPAASPVAATPAATSPATAAATPSRTNPPTRFDGPVTLAGGGYVIARCTGTGEPTILLEAGGTEGNLQQWGSQFPQQLAYDATVCRYSRRGGEGSSEAPDPLTWGTMLGDADALLATLKEEAGIGGPYVFVGWSFGGEVALGEAVAHQDETVGLVILDTDFPGDFMAQCLAAGRPKADCQAAFESDLPALAIEQDLVASIKPLPGIPILLISAIRPSPDCVVEPGASGAFYDMGAQRITAPDCATLFQEIADIGLTKWQAIGSVTQTKVDADHDGLIRGAGTQIAELIRDLIRGT